MQLAPLAVIEAWQAAIHANDFEELCAITATDIELVGPSGTSRGHAMLRDWISSAGRTDEPLRWFCGRGQVVIQQRVGAHAFRVLKGRVVSHQRFASLFEALFATALTDDDEVLR